MRRLIIFLFFISNLFIIPTVFSNVAANYTYYQYPSGYMYPTVYVPHQNQPWMPPTTYTNTNYAVPYGQNTYSMPQQQQYYYPQQQYQPQLQQYQPPCYYEYYWERNQMGYYQYAYRWYCPPMQYYYR